MCNVAATGMQNKAVVLRNGRRGFTLIELLVVVAILALLISILLPSLRQARQKAKLTVCKANMKEVANLTSLYQTEYAGRVPIVYNYYANGRPYWEAPARACWLSVALRDYHDGLQGLRNITSKNGLRFDPEECWYPETMLRNEYENEIMPEFWVCPFARADGDGRVFTEQTAFFAYYEWEGRHEYYQTFLWPNMQRDIPPGGRPWPGGPGEQKRGQLLYAEVNWNMVPSAARAGEDMFKNSQHRTWDDKALRDLGAASAADAISVFCAQGEHVLFPSPALRKYSRANVGNHKVSGKGGTNVIFADGHVSWVIGTRVGWP